jgi:hypothetical protein
VSKSATAGILILFAGYAVTSYGVVLLKGWNVPWRSWIDPLHPYRWPPAGPGQIKGRVFPDPASSG